MASKELLPLTLKESARETLKSFEKDLDPKFTKAFYGRAIDSSLFKELGMNVAGKKLQIDKKGQYFSNLIPQIFAKKSFAELNKKEQYAAAVIFAIIKQNGQNPDRVAPGDFLDLNFERGSYEIKLGAEQSGGDLSMREWEASKAKTQADREKIFTELSESGTLYNLLTQDGRDPSYAGRVALLKSRPDLVAAINGFLDKNTSEKLDAKAVNLGYKSSNNDAQNKAFMKAYLALRKNELFGAHEASPAPVAENLAPAPGAVPAKVGEAPVEVKIEKIEEPAAAESQKSKEEEIPVSEWGELLGYLENTKALYPDLKIRSREITWPNPEGSKVIELSNKKGEEVRIYMYPNKEGSYDVSYRSDLMPGKLGGVKDEEKAARLLLKGLAEEKGWGAQLDTSLYSSGDTKIAVNFIAKTLSDKYSANVNSKEEISGISASISTKVSQLKTDYLDMDIKLRENIKLSTPGTMIVDMKNEKTGDLVKVILIPQSSGGYRITWEAPSIKVFDSKKSISESQNASKLLRSLAVEHGWESEMNDLDTHDINAVLEFVAKTLSSEGLENK